MSYEINYENAAGVVLMTIPVLVETGQHVQNYSIDWGLTLMGGLAYTVGMGLILLKHKNE